MKTIHKYYLRMDALCEIPMPEDSKILSVGVQFDNPAIWVEVDINKKEVIRKFQLIQTGDVVEVSGKRFIGTFILNEGHYILHLYEILSA